MSATQGLAPRGVATGRGQVLQAAPWGWGGHPPHTDRGGPVVGGDTGPGRSPGSEPCAGATPWLADTTKLPGGPRAGLRSGVQEADSEVYVPRGPVSAKDALCEQAAQLSGRAGPVGGLGDSVQTRGPLGGPQSSERGPRPSKVLSGGLPGPEGSQGGPRRAGRGGAAHQGAELHHQQVGRHLRALGQAPEQVAVLQGPAGANRLPP